jgi:hypothetical protein
MSGKQNPIPAQETIASCHMKVHPNPILKEQLKNADLRIVDNKFAVPNEKMIRLNAVPPGSWQDAGRRSVRAQKPDETGTFSAFKPD